MFWLLDHVVILSRLNFLNKNEDKFVKNSATAWLIGLILGIIYSLKKLIELKKEEQKQGEKNKDPIIESESKRVKTIYLLNLIKNIFDLVPSTALSGFLNRSVNCFWLEV